MLTYKEKDDTEARVAVVDAIVARWRSVKSEAHAELLREFHNKLMISLIYHDAALEGEVLSHGEIKAATDTNIISDASLIPSYEEIKNFHAACEFAFAPDAKRKTPKSVKVDLVRELLSILDSGAEPAATSYRKENPLHRLYYHEIAAPEQIPQRMRKFGEWLEGPEAAALPPVQRAAEAHHMLMAIFPWAKQSGRIARILANVLLDRADYPLAVIHSIDRQRYYEALRGEPRQLVSVYLEAVETHASAAIRVYEEALKFSRAS